MNCRKFENLWPIAMNNGDNDNAALAKISQDLQLLSTSNAFSRLGGQQTAREP